MHDVIYKICPAQAWARAEETGLFWGSAVDLQDGFIHFSAPDQVEETAARHFRGQTDLLLLAFRPQHLGEALRWEPSRGGALFPHLYGPLAVTLCEGRWALGSGPDGEVLFPLHYRQG